MKVDRGRLGVSAMPAASSIKTGRSVKEGGLSVFSKLVVTGYSINRSKMIELQ